MEMPLKINATRMELLKLKKRIKLAERGHKLLKEKRDGLMKQFISLIKSSKEDRKSIEERLAKGFESIAITRAMCALRDFESTTRPPLQTSTVEVESRTIMNIRVPLFELREQKAEELYGVYELPAEFDNALRSFTAALPDIVELAAREKAIKLLSYEVEKTRRRVNALEHILIPTFKYEAKRIEMKLDEMERSSFSCLMKIKAMIEAK